MAVKSIYRFFAFLILFGLSPTFFAQQMAVELKDLCQNADVIITGRVTQQISNWNEDNTRIYTLATIEVEEYLKGNNASGSVVVNYLGGEVGDVGELYSHMPRFEDEEEVLVFLKRDDQTTQFKVLSGEEGKINIIRDPKTGEKVTNSNVRINSLKAQINSYLNE